jgi:hypothetical protein
VDLSLYFGCSYSDALRFLCGDFQPGDEQTYRWDPPQTGIGMTESLQEWVDRTTFRRFLFETVLEIEISLADDEADRLVTRRKGMPTGLYVLPFAVARRATAIRVVDPETIDTTEQEARFRDHFKRGMALDELKPDERGP